VQRLCLIVDGKEGADLTAFQEEPFLCCK
jgi:hypothetical protein